MTETEKQTVIPARKTEEAVMERINAAKQRV
jgi:hypothetical protein